MWKAYDFAPTLLKSFSRPFQGRLAIRVQDLVVDLGVYVLGIDEETVDIKYTGADRWECGLHVHDGC